MLLSGKSKSSSRIVAQPKFLAVIGVIDNFGAHRLLRIQGLAEVCSGLGGGTMTTPDDVDGIGDYVYDNCEYFGWVYNGTISVTGSFNADKTAFDGSYIYDHFSITNDQFNAIYDGMIDIVWSDDGIVTSGHYEIPSLTMV
jgi:hypothetical protein